MEQHDALIDTMTEVARQAALTSAPAGVAIVNMLTVAADTLRSTASPEKVQALLDRRAEILGVTSAHTKRTGAAIQVEP